MRDFKHPDILKNREELDRRKKYNDEYLKVLKKAVKRVFEDTEDGRIVFKHILDYCDIFSMTMTGSSWTFFNEGKRDVGLHLLNLREMSWEDEVSQRRDERLKQLDKEKK